MHSRGARAILPEQALMKKSEKNPTLLRFRALSQSINEAATLEVRPSGRTTTDAANGPLRHQASGANAHERETLNAGAKAPTSCPSTVPCSWREPRPAMQL